MQAAKRLNHNARIGIFSPSEPVTETRRPRLDEGIKILHNNGFGTKFSRHAFSLRAYMAGSVQERVNDIWELALDQEVHALMASWGGKSCNQLLPYIDYRNLLEARKPILAFSDGCVLLNAITAQTGLITFHGPNVAGKLSETKHADLSILTYDFREKRINLLGDPTKTETRVLRPGNSKGRLFGGNLSTFVLGVVGSKFIPQFEEGILFWESVEHTPQIVDEYLVCLRNAGVFEKLTGMIIGDFIYPDTVTYKTRDPFEMISDIVAGYKFPVVYCRTFGHPPQLENPTIPIGAMCELDTNSMFLRLMEPVVM